MNLDTTCKNNFNLNAKRVKQIVRNHPICVTSSAHRKETLQQCNKSQIVIAKVTALVLVRTNDHASGS